MPEQPPPDRDRQLISPSPDSTSIARRAVLQTTAIALSGGATGVTVGAAQETIDIEHSLSISATSVDPGDFEQAASHKLNIARSDDEPITFGGETGRKLRIINRDTGRRVTLEPSSDSETVQTDRLRIEPAGEPDPSGLVSTVVTAIGPAEREASSVTITVNVSGDTDPFPKETFGRFAVQLLDSDETMLGETGERIIGTGYQYEFEQAESTLRITRDAGVNPDWEVGFGVADEADDVVFPSLGANGDDLISVEHSAEADTFEIDLTRLEVPAGEYDAELVMAAPGTELEQLHKPVPGRRDVIITLRNPFRDPIVINDEWDGTAPNLDASITVSPEPPTVGQPATLDASDSTAPDSEITEYRWDLTGDGETDTTGERVEHTFDEPGPIDVTLTVINSADKEATTSVSLTVSDSDGLPTAPGEPSFSDVIGVIEAHNTNSEYADTGITPDFGDVLDVIQAHNAG